MNKRQKFSILISANGKAEITSFAVKSVLEQKDHLSETEIIVMDNARGDNVKNMLESFRSPNIFYFKTPDYDPAKSVEASYQKSTGDYVLWMCHDDYLLPYEFNVFEEALEKTGAEVITGHHVYFCDKYHPIVLARNTLKIIDPKDFDCEYHVLDPKGIVRILLGVGDSQKDPFAFRIHPIATLVSRTLLERIRQKIGFIQVPHLMCNQANQVLTFALAKSVVGIGMPLAIAGRLGILSLTQDFYTKEKVLWRKRYKFHFSPVSGDTYTNHIRESLLAAVHCLGEDDLKDIDVQSSYVPFFKGYARSLVLANQEFFAQRYLFNELEAAVKKFSEKENLTPFIKKQRRLAYFLQPLKSLNLWRSVINFLVIKDSVYSTLRATVRRILWGDDQRRKRHIFIPLEKYGVQTIAELAQRLPEIILKETGKNIYAE